MTMGRRLDEGWSRDCLRARRRIRGLPHSRRQRSDWDWKPLGGDGDGGVAYISFRRHRWHCAETTCGILLQGPCPSRQKRQSCTRWRPFRPPVGCAGRPRWPDTVPGWGSVFRRRKTDDHSPARSSWRCRTWPRSVWRWPPMAVASSQRRTVTWRRAGGRGRNSPWRRLGVCRGLKLWWAEKAAVFFGFLLRVSFCLEEIHIRMLLALSIQSVFLFWYVVYYWVTVLLENQITVLC